MSNFLVWWTALPVHIRIALSVLVVMVLTAVVLGLAFEPMLTISVFVMLAIAVSAVIVAEHFL